MFRRTRKNPTATVKDFTDGDLVPNAVDADLAAREIGFVDDGGGTGHFTIGGVPISGTLVPPAATWSGVAGKPDVLTVNEAPLNPERYGAIGDDTADDTDAIMDALTAFMQAQDIYGGGSGKKAATLEFRRGSRYRVTDKLSVPVVVNTDGGVIIGHGAEIRLDHATEKTAFEIDTTGTTYYYRNFTIDGLTLLNGGMRMVCVPGSFNYVYGFTVKDLFIEGALDHGFFTSYTFEGNLINPRVGVDNSVTTKDCLHFEGVSSLQLIGGTTRRGRHGLYSLDADMNVDGYTGLDSKDYGMNMESLNGNVLAGIHLERCQTGKSDLLSSGGSGAAAQVTGGAHIDNLFAYDWTDSGLRRMTYALSAYATASRSIVVTGGLASNVSTHTYVNGAASSDITLLGVPSYTENATYISAGGRLTVLGKGDNLARGKKSRFHRYSGSDVALSTRLGAESMDRLGITAAGEVQWAASESAPDVTMGRTAANVLSMGTGDSFRIPDGTYNGGNLRMGAYYVWVDASGTARIKGSLPNTDTDGSPIGVPAAVTTANLEDITHGINVTGKYAGKRVYCSTHGRWHWTAGATAASVWKDWNGTADVTAHTPV